LTRSHSHNPQYHRFFVFMLISSLLYHSEIRLFSFSCFHFVTSAQFSQQPAVELTAEAMVWLNQRLDSCLEQHGKISPDSLAKLDWPDSIVTGKTFREG
jgi:hypothetical protein